MTKNVNNEIQEEQKIVIESIEVESNNIKTEGEEKEYRKYNNRR